MEAPIVALCLFFGITLSGSLCTIDMVMVKFIIVEDSNKHFFAVHFVPILSKSHHKSHQDLISNQDILDISQQLFDEDHRNFLSLVTVNYQGFLNTTNINEDHAPEK